MKLNPFKTMILACLMVMAALPSRAAGKEDLSASTYVIGQGDILFISVWKDESLTREAVVLPDGTISFPLIGIVKAEGRTVDELKSDMAERINRYVPNPVLSVSVKNPASLYVYVIGRVNNPGRFVLNSTVNVLQALAMAGGLNPFAENNGIKIMRTENGASTVLPFRYNDVVKGKSLEQNVFLKRGDVVVVP